MDKSNIAIIGKGITSRANLEALLEDYIYAKGKEAALVLGFKTVPSQGQIFAAQYVKDKGKEVIVFCDEGANVSSFPTATVNRTNNPIFQAIDSSSVVMLLWDNTEEACLDAANYCKSVEKTPLNLCEGLSIVEIPRGSSEPVAEPEPVVAPVTSSLTEAQKAEIKKAVLKAVEVGLQDALGRL